MTTKALTRLLRRLGLLLACWSVTAGAGQDILLEIPLARLMSTDRPLRLEKSRGTQTLSVPLSARTRLRSAVLELDLVNSVALLKHRSQLVVQLNDRVVAQLPLDPAAPEAEARVKIPAGYFEPGYNRLSFSATHHYSDQCEDATAPELWTEIDSRQSRLILEIRPRELGDARLSELDELFDEKLWAENRVNIVSAGDTDDRLLTWGGLLAQGVALRYHYVPVSFRHLKAAPAAAPAAGGQAFPGLEQAPLARSDTLLVGTREQLLPFLSPRVAARIDGAHLALYPLDADPRRLVMLVSGTTPEEVTLAARTFGFITLPYPDRQWMRVDSLRTPPPVPHAGRGRALPNGDYAFSRFGYHTRTLQGMDAEPAALNVDLPPDLYAPESAMVELDLHLAYGAGMRGDSVLNLYLNDLFETSIALSEPTGGNYRHYRVKIPLRSLQKGANRIELRPLMIPMVSGECVMLNTENLLLTLFDDSRLIMPNASHFTSLPDLRLLALTGFPHTVQGDGSDLYLYLGSGEPGVSGAAWTLLGKLAQRTGLPLDRVRISLGRPSPPGPALVLGTLDGLDPQLLAGAPLRPGEEGLVPYPVAPALAPGEGSTGWIERLYRRMLDLLAMERAPAAGSRLARVGLEGGLGRYTLAMQYRSRALGDHTATVLLARDAATLYQGVERLVQPDFWNGLGGDLTLWRDSRESIVSARLGEDFQVGRLDPWWRANFYIARRPWLWGGLVVGLVLIMAWLGARLLRAFRRRHRPGSEPDHATQ